MKGKRFDHLPEEERDWIDAYLEGTIDPDSFNSLQERMMQSPDLRSTMRGYLALDDALRSDLPDAESTRPESVGSPWLAQGEPVSGPKVKITRFPSLLPTAIAALLAFLLGLSFLFWNSGPKEGIAQIDPNSRQQGEPSAEGFAVLRRIHDVQWTDAEEVLGEGDTLGAEVIKLSGGSAEIQFFSGAIMVVEGPAEISLKSAWEATCHKGAVRMRVPPAARGFKLHGPATEIVDLGTEFGLVVRESMGHVEVFDGEIALRHRDEERKIVRKGGALGLAVDGPSVAEESGTARYPDAAKVDIGAARRLAGEFEAWIRHRDELARDERLIAYYTFDRESMESPIPNLTVPRNAEFDGAVIMAEPVDGRWPGKKSALEFRKPGSRVRVNLPGEFSAFTFAAWVRIDSLDRWYNALFMGDSYENGEPHWQIRDDGKMMLSVMVDDSRQDPKNPDGAQKRFHRVYYSEPMWDPSMSGQWMHLVSVFDPQSGRVSHYVNGERISRESIPAQYMVKELRIGNGEIGNWGQPFREDPTFAIRNLNGRMDEIAIFDAALQDNEVAELFEKSRSKRK